MFDPYRVREDFPILNRVINGYKVAYLDNAATSQKPIQVINAIKEFYEKHNANVHRAVHTLSQEATEIYEDAHKEVANFINADSMEEIIFVRNTTEAINLIAYSWGLKNLDAEDEILITLMDHHSNIVPWYILSKIKGFKLRFIELNRDGTLKHDDFENKISEKTKIVCIPHVSNVLGIINDVKYVVKVAHEREALVLLDGAQSVPHMPVDIKDIDADFLVFSGHKMLGPTGIGILYGKKDLLNSMEPFLGGGDMINEVRYNQSADRCDIEWNDLPWKFEAGTPHVAGAAGFIVALEYLKKVGLENIHKYEGELTEYALKKMEGINSLSIYGPKNCRLRSGIIAFNIEGLSSHELATFLNGYSIMVRSGHHCAQPLHQTMGIPSSTRASFYLYNTEEEIDRLADALKEIEMMMNG